jgi:hypothetical protein
MPQEIVFSPLLQRIPILKGFLSGSLLVAGIANPFGIPLQAVLFFGGILVFIDGIMPNGEVSIVATVLASFLGGLASFLAALEGLSVPWTAAVALAAAWLYFIRFSKRKKPF